MKGAGNYSGSKIAASKIAGSKIAGSIIAGRDYSSSNIAAEIIAALFLCTKTRKSCVHATIQLALTQRHSYHIKVIKRQENDVFMCYLTLT